MWAPQPGLSAPHHKDCHRHTSGPAWRWVKLISKGNRLNDPDTSHHALRGEQVQGFRGASP